MHAWPMLERAFDGALSDQRIVGGVVLVALDGEIAYRRAAGLADRESGRAMRETDVFRLASITKPIVTAAVLRLVERGRLGLDQPVTRWLPDFRPALDGGVAPSITIRQLLTHTSGLTYGFLQPPGGSYERHRVSDGLDQPGLPMAEELRRISSAGLAFAPGERWGYSVALDVLGAVLEEIEGARLDDVLRTHVTGPLGFAGTGFALSTPQLAILVAPYADGRPAPVRMDDEGYHISFADLAGPYAGLAGVRFVPKRVLDPASFQSGGGGLNGTAGDFLKFLEAIRTGGGPILSPRTAAAMMTNQTGAFFIPNRGPGWGFGFGGAVLEDPGAAQTPQSKGTWGWGGVWGHHWFVDPQMRLTVVIMTNTALEGMMGRFPRDVRDAVYKDIAAAR